MAYLIYTRYNGVQVIHDEGIWKHGKHTDVVAKFDLPDKEAYKTIDELKLLYPYSIPGDTNGRSQT